MNSFADFSGQAIRCNSFLSGFVEPEVMKNVLCIVKTKEDVLSCNLFTHKAVVFVSVWLLFD